MKMCNAEAMKKVKNLEEELTRLRNNEAVNCQILYKEGEAKQESNYDYQKTRKEIENLNAQIREIKKALSIANSTYVIEEFNMTIGEALVYLAQLNTEYRGLSMLSIKNKISRRITPNGVIEYTECMYNPEEARRDEKQILETIGKLQVAIDRANLNCFIKL